MAVLLAFGEHASGLGPIDVEIALPTCQGDAERKDAHARADPQQLTLAARHPNVVARQAGLLIDDPSEGLLNEVGQCLALCLALTQRKFRLVGLGGFTDKGIAHVALLYHRRPIHTAYQGRRGVTVTHQGFAQKGQQYGAQPGQRPIQRKQAPTRWSLHQHIQLIDELLLQRAEKPTVVLVILIQPDVERVNRIQFEGEPQQVFAPGGRKLAVELIEAVQQIEFAQYHIERQARTQVAAHFVQAGAQPVGQRNALLRRAMQQCRQVDDQHHAVKRSLAAISQ